jgi:hypothetical protein
LQFRFGDQLIDTERRELRRGKKRPSDEEKAKR